jgi:hypothetical protein
MLKIDVTKAKTVKWPITAMEPTDGGKFTPRSFTAHFELLPETEMQELIGKGGLEADETTIKKALIGWDGVQDDDGNPIPLTDDVLSWVFEHAVWLRGAIAKAYLDAHYGGGKRKN